MRARVFSTAILLACVFAIAPVGGSIISVDPDAFGQWTDISSSFDGVFLSSLGEAGGLDGRIYARRAGDPASASTGANVFGHNIEGVDASGVNRNETWIYPHVVLSAYFGRAADYVSIDVIAGDDTDEAAVNAYDSDRQLLATIFTPILTAGQIYTLEVTRADFDISYVSITGVGGTAVHLDNLTANVPEPTTLAILGCGLLLARRRS